MFAQANIRYVSLDNELIGLLGLHYP